jgi:hypothetical protein
MKLIYTVFSLILVFATSLNCMQHIANIANEWHGLPLLAGCLASSRIQSAFDDYAGSKFRKAVRVSSDRYCYGLFSRYLYQSSAANVGWALSRTIKFGCISLFAIRLLINKNLEVTHVLDSLHCPGAFSLGLLGMSFLGNAFSSAKQLGGRLDGEGRAPLVPSLCDTAVHLGAAVACGVGAFKLAKFALNRA